jgi:hypothetical protein
VDITEFVAAPETVLELARRHPDELARAGARAAFGPAPTRRAILAGIDELEGS